VTGVLVGSGGAVLLLAAVVTAVVLEIVDVNAGDSLHRAERHAGLSRRRRLLQRALVMLVVASLAVTAVRIATLAG
jgi:hypothetical protein